MSSDASRMPANGELLDGDAAAKEAGSAPEALSLGKLASSSLQRYIIREAEVTLEVKDARAAAEAMAKAVKQLGGYVGDTMEETDPLGVRTVTVQMRVPANRFDDLMRAIEAQGTVLHRHIGTQDVTEEYVDVQSRLRNLKRTEERLLSHLQRTARLADTLAVEKELSRVRMEIEQYEGRMRYLSHTVQFSTATVSCREKARPRPPVPPESFSSGEVASAAVRGLVGFARTLWTWIIWIAVWIPVWVPVLLLARWGLRRLRPTTPHQ